MTFCDCVMCQDALILWRDQCDALLGAIEKLSLLPEQRRLGDSLGVS